MCTLLAFVDDATSRLMTLRFVVSESAFDYFRTTRAYLETHGKPVAFYSDKHNIFRVNNGEGGDRVTQFGRALEALNIDIICANSPQAKGRVERAFGTLQDRLVKELRLAGISSIEAANAWLPGFIASHNARFGREPANAKDLHRKLTAADDLDEILAWREERTVTQNLTLHYDRMMLILEPTPLARGLVRKKVDVVNYPDGRFAVQFERQIAAVSDVRQDPDRPAWHNRRQQAAIGGAGDGEGAAGGIRAEASTRACRPGNGHRTIWTRRDCHRRGGRHALPWPRQSPDRFRLTARHLSVLGTSDGLKGCAARTGKPASALDPAARAQPGAMVPFRSGPVRK